MTRPETIVHVVDDDPDVRDSLRWLIESVGLPVRTYGDAREFLDKYDPERLGCLVLDVRLPGLSGLELQQELMSRPETPPIIMISGHAEVPSAVQAVKAGAIDFIEKPFSEQILLDRIQEALEQQRRAREARTRRAASMALLATLTPREREVMQLIVAGKRNKVIAAELGITEKTVEVHRSRVMEKLQVESLAALVQLVLLARAHPHDAPPAK